MNAREWQLANGYRWQAVVSSVVLGQKEVARRILRELWLNGTDRDPSLVTKSKTMGLLNEEEGDRMFWGLMQHEMALRRVVEEIFGVDDDGSESIGFDKTANPKK